MNENITEKLTEKETGRPVRFRKESSAKAAKRMCGWKAPALISVCVLATAAAAAEGFAIIKEVRKGD